MKISAHSYPACRLTTSFLAFPFKRDGRRLPGVRNEATGLVHHGTELVNPDLAAIARGAGVLGLHAEDPKDIRPALEPAFAHPGPALVGVAVNRQELAIPPSLKLDQIADFNPYMTRTLLHGRGDEIIDLAPTNLFRS